jgi:FkbM family methyltransferase
MILDLQQLQSKYACNFRGVIHVGANEAEEYAQYKAMGMTPITFFDPIAYNCDMIRHKVASDPTVTVHECALGDTAGTHTFYVANNRASSSLLKPAVHVQQYPGITFSECTTQVKTLDSFNFSDAYNFLNMDVQGFELQVLQGGMQTLRHMQYILLEINTVEMYEHCVQFDQLQQFLLQHHFEFKEMDTAMGAGNWGDAFFVRKQVAPQPVSDK